MIITDEAALRLDCTDVAIDEYSSLKERLEAELGGTTGVGLAAPQIGIAKNMAIVRIPGSKPISIDLVNCKIKAAYDKTIFKGEGCLSFPELFKDTFRYQEIEICDNLVYPYNFICTGFAAVVCQHELDHLVGKLLPDFGAKEKLR